MIELSRLALYKTLLSKIEKQQDNQPIESEILHFLRVNINTLNKIEPYFLTVDLRPGEYYNPTDYPEFFSHADERSRNTIVKQLQENIETLKVDKVDLKEKVIQLKTGLGRLIPNNSQNNNQKEEKPRNIFYGIIKELCSFNNALFSGNAEPFFPGTGTMPQVFLSHAYIDKLYSYVLFQFFLEKGIYLYVDWMHEEAQTDGRQLKNILNKELSHSEQLLFLRTTNSELCIQGQHYIRPWCMWEIGNYYRNSNHCIKPNMYGKGGDQLYLLNLYSVDRYENDLHLHGFRILEGIERRMMVGKEIEPSSKAENY